MPTRRYEDDEVREIFSLATAGEPREHPLSAQADGLTLDELQQIGREAGIEPARVAQAAASLDARGTQVPVQRSFGLPVGVSRVVDLPRAPTDREWEQMIAMFRTTFGVQGLASSSGGIRDWSNGNLHIAVEPTAGGEQLRLSTRKGDAASVNAVGLVMAGMSMLMGAVVMASGKPGKALIIVGMFGGMALAAFGANVVRLPRWAREREQQMETIAAATVKLLGS